MTEWNVYLVILSLLGFIGTMYSMFYKPTHELKIEIVKLNSNLEHLRESDTNQNARLNRHSDKLDDHDKRIIILEGTKFVKDRI